MPLVFLMSSQHMTCMYSNNYIEFNTHIQSTRTLLEHVGKIVFLFSSSFIRSFAGHG